MKLPYACPNCSAPQGYQINDVIPWHCGTWHPADAAFDPARVVESAKCITRQRDQLAARVRRLEEAGDYWIPRDSDAQEAWTKAKEAQP